MSIPRNARWTKLYLNSQYREDAATTFPHDCRFRITTPGLRVHRAVISAMSLPVTAYNVDSNSNVLSLLTPAAHVLTVPDGNYSGGSLATAIQTLLQTVDVGFTCTFDPATLHFTIQRPTAFTLVFDDPAYPAAAGLAYVLGFPQVSTSSALTHTSPYAANLNYPSLCLVMSSALSAGSPPFLGVSSEMSQCVARIPIFGTFGTMSHWTANHVLHPTDYADLSSILETIDIRLVTEDRVELDLNGADWTMEIDVLTSEK